MAERYLCTHCHQVITDAEEFVITNKEYERDPSKYVASHVHCYHDDLAQQEQQKAQAEAGAKAPINCPKCGKTFSASEFREHGTTCQA
jgi:hypothetical protein